MNKARSSAKNARNQNGVSILFLCVLIGAIILPMVAIFTFEIVRAVTMHEQLQTSCEAAALSGAAVLAGSDSTDQMHTYADLKAASFSVFRANSVYEAPLTTAYEATSLGDIPPANGSSLFLELLNPNSTPPNQPVPPGDVNGRVVHAVASFGLVPVFGAFLGIRGPFTLKTEAHARVPQLDVVLCFDVSGSIDDQTPVTFVKRYWDQAGLRTRYDITTARAGAGTTGGLAHGRLYDILLPPPEGSSVNALPPQNLDYAASGHTRPLTFSGSLRGGTNTGAPPGNYPNGGVSVGNAYTFTDLIVNINENGDHTLKFPYTSPGGFTYPNIETVVEAARGNLENGAVFSGAMLHTVPGLSGVTPRVGYKADYLTEARKKVEPLSKAQQAAKDFFTIMNKNTEANFGLTCFSTDAGSAPGETVNERNVASNYSAGGSTNFPRPGVQLSKTNTNYGAALSAIDLTLANGSTNIGDALAKAKQMLVSNSRPGAKRAIVVCTDGQPTAPSSGSYPWWYARSIAYEIEDKGIPIYTIGLAQNNQIIPGECNILNDDPSRVVHYTDTNGNAQTYTPGGGNPGISYIAGNRGKFFLVTNANHLRLTFENIARQLVQMVSIDAN